MDESIIWLAKSPFAHPYCPYNSHAKFSSNLKCSNEKCQKQGDMLLIVLNILTTPETNI